MTYIIPNDYEYIRIRENLSSISYRTNIKQEIKRYSYSKYEDNEKLFIKSMIILINNKIIDLENVPESPKMVNKSTHLIVKNTNLKICDRIGECDFCQSKTDVFYMIKRSKTLWLYVDLKCAISMMNLTKKFKSYYGIKHLSLSYIKFILILEHLNIDIMSVIKTLFIKSELLLATDYVYIDNVYINNVGIKKMIRLK